MNIHEIFYSIQGEGKYIGTPAVFVRTQGCSLHCPFCDSAATWPEGGRDKKYSARDILNDIQRITKNKRPIVVITGGEPTEQPDLYDVVEDIKYAGYSVHLETNGTKDVLRGYFTHVVCSPKPAANYRIAKGCDELKYVVEKGDDLLKMISAPVREQYAGRIWLQPKAEGNKLIPVNMDYCFEQAMIDPRFRVGVQLHKIMGVA